MYAPEKMLHWFCAHDKQTIARDHPSKVSPDRVIEQSKNKYKKSQGN